jgi:hypothetical protein
MPIVEGDFTGAVAADSDGALPVCNTDELGVAALVRLTPVH